VKAPTISSLVVFVLLVFSVFASAQEEEEEEEESPPLSWNLFVAPPGSEEPESRQDDGPSSSSGKNASTAEVIELSYPSLSSFPVSQTCQGHAIRGPLPVVPGMVAMPS
jgi:hypothetical protein